MTVSVIRIWHIFWAVLDRAERVHLGLIAAGVAFFGMFAIFPALAALIAVFGLVADPSIVEQQLSLLQEIIPDEAYALFQTQIASLLGAQPDTLGWATALSTALAFWSARAGVAALMQGLNAISGARNRRGVRHYAVALLLTLCLLGIAVVALLVVVVAPVLLAFVPLPVLTGLVLTVLRWVVALFIVLAALGLLYRFGPNPQGARIGWVSPGSVMVVIVWIAASAGLSTYLSNFGSYNEVYGSIGAVVAMLLWLYISAYLVLMGAVLNVTLAETTETEAAA